MTVDEKAAFFSVAGSGFAAIGAVWFVLSVFSNGEAWAGAVVSTAAAYFAKNKAYWTLVDERESASEGRLS